MDTPISGQAEVIEFAANQFIDVPVILQFEDTPPIEVVKTRIVNLETQLARAP